MGMSAMDRPHEPSRKAQLTTCTAVFELERTSGYVGSEDQSRGSVRDLPDKACSDAITTCRAERLHLSVHSLPQCLPSLHLQCCSVSLLLSQTDSVNCALQWDQIPFILLRAPEICFEVLCAGECFGIPNNTGSELYEVMTAFDNSTALYSGYWLHDSLHGDPFVSKLSWEADIISACYLIVTGEPLTAARTAPELQGESEEDTESTVPRTSNRDDLSHH